MSRLTRDGTAEPVSRDQILRRERGQDNINFPCSADHEQDWQPYPVDHFPCYMWCDDHIYIYNLQTFHNGKRYLYDTSGAGTTLVVVCTVNTIQYNTIQYSSTSNSNSKSNIVLIIPLIIDLEHLPMEL